MKYEGPLYGKVGRKYIPLKQTSQDVDGMERLLRLTRAVLNQLACLGNGSMIGSSEGNQIAIQAMDRIDAALDPNNLEDPERTREEMAADARELNRIAPTPAEKFALMFGGIPNPNYVDAPMQVSVTRIDHVTGEVKQSVATTDDELRTLLDDEQHREVAEEMRIARENASAEGMTVDEFREQSRSLKRQFE